MKSARLASIKELLEAQGQVTVQDLARQMGVSNVTIRSDLIALEEQGVLFRTHGGAVRRDAAPAPEQAFAGATENQAKKRELAVLAAQYAKENSWIYLSSGTTCIELAKELVSRSVNVVTGNLAAAQILAKSSTVQVLVTGGNLVPGPSYMFLRGDWFLRAMDDISVEQAFLSVSGVNPEGYSWGNALECESQMMDAIRKATSEIVVLADSSKFGKRSLLCAEKLDFADTVVSNRDIPEDYHSYYLEHGIKLILPPAGPPKP